MARGERSRVSCRYLRSCGIVLCAGAPVLPPRQLHFLVLLCSLLLPLTRPIDQRVRGASRIYRPPAVRTCVTRAELGSALDGGASGLGGMMKQFWQAFSSDDSGQGLVEYALIIALVAVGLIAILLVLRNSIGNVFNNAATQLNNAPTSPYP